MKKLLSALLVMIMVFAMTTTVFASNDHAHTITITGNAGHTYTAYQVFKGEISGGKLTNIEWGDGVIDIENEYEADLLSELKKLSAYSACNSAEEVAAVLQGFENDSDEIKAFSKLVNTWLTTTTAGTSTENVVGGVSTYTIPVVGDGYYFVKDTGSIPQGHTNTEYILKVVSNVSIEAKDSIVTSEKKVMDKNDATGITSGWQDSADYDIGDYVPFKLSATLPNNYENYTSYSMTFHDYEVFYGTAPNTYAGLQLVMKNTDYPFVVKVDGVAIHENLYEVDMSSNGHCTFEVKIPNVKLTSAKNNSVITVEYYSKLTADANLGALGNTNKMHVTYTNDVYQGGEKGTTKEDAVIVFTYQAVVNKVDQKGDPLTGAEFTLEKFVANASGTKEYKGVKGEWVAISSVKNTEGTQFSFKGLDDGEYKLTESKVPSGYNEIDDIYFTVTAEHDIESDSPALTTLTGNVATGTINFTPNVTDGTLTKTIENRQGATLPSTGGIGTTMFYVVGATLVLGAAVVLVTRKRMAIEN